MWQVNDGELFTCDERGEQRSVTAIGTPRQQAAKGSRRRFINSSRIKSTCRFATVDPSQLKAGPVLYQSTEYSSLTNAKDCVVSFDHDDQVLLRSLCLSNATRGNTWSESVNCDHKAMTKYVHTVKNIISVLILDLRLGLAATDSCLGLWQGSIDRIAILVKSASVFGFLEEDVASLLVFLVVGVGDGVEGDVEHCGKFGVVSLQFVLVCS